MPILSVFARPVVTGFGAFLSGSQKPCPYLTPFTLKVLASAGSLKMPRPSAASILLPKPSSLTGATTFEASTVMTAGPAANSAGAAARAAAVRVRDRYFMANLLCSPKSCHPSATGLGSFGPNAQKLRVLFGGPALRCSVRLRRTHTFEKGIVDISMALTYHLHLVNMLTYTGNLKNNFSGKTAFPPDGGGKTG